MSAFRHVSVVLAFVLAAVAGVGSTAARASPAIQTTRSLQPLEKAVIRVQGLQRTVGFYLPEKLSANPALLIALHGSGGSGQRFRRLTDGAFDILADRHGFMVAYPDALGGQWNDCRGRAPYHAALAGVSDIVFMRAVIRQAAQLSGREPSGVFAVGYSNGGHMVFRIAFDMPDAFTALATIGAHLPVPEERDCTVASSPAPVSILIVSGSADPVNPWAGGPVRAPGGAFLGRVLSAGATVGHFRKRLGSDPNHTVIRHPDIDHADGARVETRRWAGKKNEVVWMAVYGGGHSLPHPTAAFPVDRVGRTSRDLNGAAAIWHFFDRCHQATAGQ